MDPEIARLMVEHEVDEGIAEKAPYFAQGYEGQEKSRTTTWKNSNATAERYLDELEKEGKLTQHGTIGQNVFYTPK